MELLRIIENVLGTGRKLRNNEVAFHCPFCNHYKPKLQVNLESHNWHCWVCNAKGRKVVQLFKKLKVSNQILNQLYDIVDEYVPIKKTEDVKESVSLPKEMLYLWDKRTTPEYKHTMMYLMKRGITAKDDSIQKKMIIYRSFSKESKSFFIILSPRIRRLSINICILS